MELEQLFLFYSAKKDNKTKFSGVRFGIHLIEGGKLWKGI